MLALIEGFDGFFAGRCDSMLSCLWSSNDPGPVAARVQSLQHSIKSLLHVSRSPSYCSTIMRREWTSSSVVDIVPGPGRSKIKYRSKSPSLQLLS